jgi:hypothetical protein
MKRTHARRILISALFHTSPERVFHQGGTEWRSVTVDSHTGGVERMNLMFNHIDTRQVQALVDHRREQVATDAAKARQALATRRAEHGRVGPIRTAVGVRLMRAGARIAGVYVHSGPHLNPGV